MVETLRLIDRIDIYKDMIDYLLEAKQYRKRMSDFCWMVEVPLLDTPCLKGAIHRISELPELIARKPDKMYDVCWWFDVDDVESRINILKDILKEIDDGKINA